jgi:deazaflavin-dependent oxidoreductase (nitroreductase family)
MTKLPMSVRASNKVIRGLHRLGVPVGPTRLLTITGRTTGLPRTTPISPVTVDGSQYLLAAYATGQWVANARASGRAVLARGRHRVPVHLVEVPPSDRGPIVAAYPIQVPQGASMFFKVGTVESPTPDGFAANATNIVVFKIDPTDREPS